MEYLEEALIQHGPLNDRIYLMKMGDAQPERLADGLLRKAADSGYSKVFAKIPESAEGPFLDAGFQKEARVPGFYDGIEPAAFLGYYLDNRRRREENPEQLDAIRDMSRDQPPSTDCPPLQDESFSFRPLVPRDTGKMSDIFQKIFPTYPFPIHDPAYLLGTMESHVAYFGIEAARKLVALASSELDRKNKNAEMTDFATLPQWRGNRLGRHLLFRMEEALKAEGIKTAYTIARAVSPGINITFSKNGYEYGGRLINNTNISGRIESMNIWYKPI
jgi:putative beta-lysine N-acetyltransferase